MLASTKKTMLGTTPLKTNMSPENQWLEDVFPTKIVVSFQGVVEDGFSNPETDYPQKLHLRIGSSHLQILGADSIIFGSTKFGN